MQKIDYNLYVEEQNGICIVIISIFLRPFRIKRFRGNLCLIVSNVSFFISIITTLSSGIWRNKFAFVSGCCHSPLTLLR